jgi:catechol 2,3-dioxygenase-like lactoylglutathione lyase family enzyme
MQLDHATIVTPQLQAVRDFFCEIVGLRVDTRPPFDFDGYWLYQGEHAVIHLIETRSDRPASRSPSRIDHIAFRIANEEEWQALQARLDARQTPYQLAEVPASGERQLFVMPSPGVTVEFVIAARA